jgi:hypothetical protein
VAAPQPPWYVELFRIVPQRARPYRRQRCYTTNLHVKPLLLSNMYVPLGAPQAGCLQCKSCALYMTSVFHWASKSRAMPIKLRSSEFRPAQTKPTHEHRRQPAVAAARHTQEQPPTAYHTIPARPTDICTCVDVQYMLWRLA